jgi:hypothetical protein
VEYLHSRVEATWTGVWSVNTAVGSVHKKVEDFHSGVEAIRTEVRNVYAEVGSVCNRVEGFHTGVAGGAAPETKGAR